MTDHPTRSILTGRSTLTRVQPVRLRVVEGPDLGKEMVIEEGTAVTGTLPQCELRLTDSTVSRRHASVELLGSRVRVRDLGSKNGTKYLGARISVAEVPIGSSVEFGATRVAILPARVAAGELSSRTELAGMLGSSQRMRRLFAEIERVAPSQAPVLIRGETGSGKEGVARGLHALSTRANGPFVVFDCAAVHPELVQSALFGHVKGAFTGAVKDALGALEQADGGTLFLDEMGELPLDLQPALLRALETRTFTRVGERKERSADFRIVAATHRDLERTARSGKFRADLYFRLAAIVLDVPPLRERTEDIPALAELFASRVAGHPVKLSASTVACLCAYRWPGNVRELRNTVERVVALGDAALPGVQDTGRPPDFHHARELALKSFERTYLSALLERHRGSTTAAAREAGIARSYFYRLLEEHGLTPGRRSKGGSGSDSG